MDEEIQLFHDDNAVDNADQSLAIASEKQETFPRLLTELKENRTPELLNIRYDLSERDISKFAQVLKANRSLLGISFLGEDIKEEKYLDDLQVQKIADVLKQNKHLKIFCLTNHAVKAAGQILSEPLRTNTSLRRLNLNGNGIGDTGAKYLGESLKFNNGSALLELSLNDNEIGVSGTRHICEALRSHKSLQAIDLRNNNIGDEGAKFLADSLKTNNIVRLLYLDGNQIHSKGVSLVADALKVDECLCETLSLNDNELGKEGIEALMAAMKVNTALKILLLKDCGVTKTQELEFNSNPTETDEISLTVSFDDKLGFNLYNSDSGPVVGEFEVKSRSGCGTYMRGVKTGDRITKINDKTDITPTMSWEDCVKIIQSVGRPIEITFTREEEIEHPKPDRVFFHLESFMGYHDHLSLKDTPDYLYES